MMQFKVILVLFFFTFMDVLAQRKPGSCPARANIGVCELTCRNDAECRSELKCCRTTCGGSVCMMPIQDRPVLQNKAGICPAKPSGPWVCSSTCSGDGDCRGTKKCCKNRCGAMVCTVPDDM